jgi:hypothetical protein
VVSSHGGKDDGGVDELGSNEMKKVTNTCLLKNVLFGVQPFGRSTFRLDLCIIKQIYNNI